MVSAARAPVDLVAAKVAAVEKEGARAVAGVVEEVVKATLAGGQARRGILQVEAGQTTHRPNDMGEYVFAC